MAYPDSFPNIQYSGGDVGLITDTRWLFGEPTARDFSDTQIQAALDLGASVAARRTKAVETGQTYITLATATRDYAFPSALYTAPAEYSLEIDGVFYCAVATASPVVNSPLGYGLQQISKRQLGHLSQNTAGAPLYWCVTREQNNTPLITIWPVPTSTYNTFICEVFFYRVANAVKAADASTTHYLPEYLREAPIFYALSVMNEAVGRIQTARQYMGYFDNLTMFFRQDRYDRVHDVDSKEMATTPDFTQI